MHYIMYDEESLFDILVFRDSVDQRAESRHFKPWHEFPPLLDLFGYPIGKLTGLEHYEQTGIHDRD